MPMLLGLVADPLDLSEGVGGGPPTLDILTTSLPQAFQGVAYSVTLSVTGGTAPYTWSILSGALPAWATLNGSTGAITGTPSGTGTAFFTVRVTDNASATADEPLSILTTPLPSGVITPFIVRRRA